MSASLVTVATFATPVEAELARNVLASEGIAAWLADAETVGSLWHAGLALGGVKLQVAEADLPGARRVLETRQGAADDGPGDYDLDDEPRRRSSPGRLAAEEEEAPDSERDVIARRAWRSAVVGLFLCPPLLQFYSTWLLQQLPWAQGDFTAAGKRAVLAALAIDGLVMGALLIVGLGFLGW